MTNPAYTLLTKIQDQLRQAQTDLVELRALLAAMSLPDWPSHVDGRRVTGYRMTRGTHGVGYVRDPQGTDPPPPYSLPDVELTPEQRKAVRAQRLRQRIADATEREAAARREP